MIVYFSASQVIAALLVFWLYRQRGYRWSHRHTLLCSIVPLSIFLFWAFFWYWLQPDFLPMHWFDRTPTVGALAFMCIPPLVVSWLLFFTFSSRVGRDYHAV
jgi:peptidoglycan biosynthesis protein MviN/MurJ (putative lipid II flippase)